MPEDKKTSALTAASALDGTEYWRGVQGAADRRVTAQQVADLALADPAIPGSGPDAAAAYALGSRRVLADGREVLYVQADGLITLGDAIGVNVGYLAFATGGGYIVGVAPYGMSSGEFGWIVVRGQVTGKVDGSIGVGGEFGLFATGSSQATGLSGTGATAVPRGKQFTSGLGATAGIWLY